MKRYIFAVVAMIIASLSSCSCEEQLSFSCPEEVSCYVYPGKQNIEANLLLGNDIPSLKGVCKVGVTKCNDKGGLYCEYMKHPTKEECNDVDDNCDGIIDEGFDNDNDGYKVCGKFADCDDHNENIFPGNEEICDGLDNDCNGVIPYQEYEDLDGDGYTICEGDCDDRNSFQNPGLFEMCDGVDNDCDGEIDNNVAEEWNSCGPPHNWGICTIGRNICIGDEVVCVDAVYPQNEICNNVDDNCNGTVDEGLIQPCSTICGMGVEYCDRGEWKECSALLPTVEICDGIDNNCDGEIDENCLCEIGKIKACILEERGCGRGYKICDSEGEWGECEPLSEDEIANLPEECNGWDDNCDGVIDEIKMICGDSNTAGIGECAMGEMLCVSGEWGECDGVVYPTDEICDYKDNDCDGEIDEDLEPHEKVDMVFSIDGSASMCPYVDALKEAIMPYVDDFNGTEHRFAIVVFPGEFNYDIMTPWYLLTPGLVDVNDFLVLLNNYDCAFPAEEPSYDVAIALLDSDDEINIGWRQDAHPYIVIITDEPGNSWSGGNQALIGSKGSNCEIGSCVNTNKKVELFVMTQVAYFNLWNIATYNEPERLLSLFPVNADRYLEMLKTVFANICL